MTPQHYCKSFEVETFLRTGGLGTQEQKFPVVTLPTSKMTIDSHSFPVFPVTSRGDVRGTSEIPWELVYSGERDIKDTTVLDPTPTALGEIQRIKTETAGPYLHYQHPPAMSIDIESKLKYDIEVDRLLPHPPAVEFTPREFVGGGENRVPPFDPAGKSTRFDTMVACTR